MTARRCRLRARRAPVFASTLDLEAGGGDPLAGRVEVGGYDGQVAPGRRADILVIDGDPTVNIWNVRRISTLIVEGNVLEREGLLDLKK